MLWSGATLGVWAIVAVAISVGVGSISAESSEPTVQVEAAIEPNPARVVSSQLAHSARIRTCGLESGFELRSGEALAVLVADRSSEDILFTSDADLALAPASVAKLFTAVAALRVLGPDYRMKTEVVDGGNGEVWLVGGGDPTVTRSPGNNYYGSTHSLQQLASATISALPGQTVTFVHIDDSRYARFARWDNTWRTNGWALGYVAPITSLQVDGDRDSPSLRLGRRSTDPSGRAGAWFAGELSQLIGVSVAVGGNSVAPPGPVIASVESAPVSELIAIMLRDSDNTLAEVLAREVALALEVDSIDAALHEALFPDGDAPEGVYFQDGSGLSPLTMLTARSVVDLLGAIDGDEALHPVLDDLPVAGETGSLRKRFKVLGAEVVGKVFAKTGSIQGVRSLAGLIDAGENGELLFSINVSGAKVSDASRDVIDALVEEIYSCGENLAHWSSITRSPALATE